MIGIVILNYNTWDVSLECIQSIQKYTSSSYRIYLVDNCSTQPLLENKQNKFADITNLVMIYAKENKGYAAGNNLGIKAAIADRCESIMICNSDILFIDNTIDILQKHLFDIPLCGLVGPRIYDKNCVFNKFQLVEKLTIHGKILNMMSKTIFYPLTKKFLKSFYFDNEEFTEPKKVFGVIGCCFMMNHDCAKFLYPLDEGTFLYEEENIIGSRLESSIFSAYVIPNTKVIHEHGVSTKGMTSFSYMCLVRSEQYYCRKYLNSSYISLSFLYFLRVSKYICLSIKNKEYRKNICSFFKNTSLCFFKGIQ